MDQVCWDGVLLEEGQEDEIAYRMHHCTNVCCTPRKLKIESAKSDGYIGLFLDVPEMARFTLGH